MPKKKPKPDKKPETAESHTHAHKLMPKHGSPEPNKNQTKTVVCCQVPVLLYDQSSHLEANLTCTTAIGRQAVEEILLFVGKEGGKQACRGREGMNLFISEDSKENQ
jgi:hypothetical protein